MLLARWACCWGGFLADAFSPSHYWQSPSFLVGERERETESCYYKSCLSPLHNHNIHKTLVHISASSRYVVACGLAHVVQKEW